MRRRRWRTAVICLGCTLCVLIVVAFVVSGWWKATARIPGFGPVSVERGGFFVRVDSASAGGIRRHDFGWSGWNVGGLKSVTITPPSSPPALAEFLGSTVMEFRFIVIPLWPLFLAVAIPTLLVWRFVPKFPRGHCRRCGYNLTGLTEARCPECGQPFEANGDAP